MKASVFALLAALAATSPAFAKNTKVADPATTKCLKLDDAEKQLTAAEPGIKVERKLVGDDLKLFNAKVEAKLHVNPPAGQDGLLILSKPDAKTFAAVMSVNGCVKGVFLIDPAFLKALDNADDGSI